MKYLLFTDYGTRPKFWYDRTNGLNRHDSRTGEIIDYIERIAIPYNAHACAKKSTGLTTFMEETGAEIVYCGTNGKDERIFVAKRGAVTADGKVIEQSNYLSIFTIKDIDETVPWLLEEYDGCEGLRRLDSFSIFDKEANIYTYS